MMMLSKFSNFPDELSENDKLREYELSGSDSTTYISSIVPHIGIKFETTFFSAHTYECSCA